MIPGSAGNPMEKRAEQCGLSGRNGTAHTATAAAALEVTEAGQARPEGIGRFFASREQREAA
jgi:hypothetical protein